MRVISAQQPQKERVSDEKRELHPRFLTRHLYGVFISGVGRVAHQRIGRVFVTTHDESRPAATCDGGGWREVPGDDALCMDQAWFGAFPMCVPIGGAVEALAVLEAAQR